MPLIDTNCHQNTSSILQRIISLIIKVFSLSLSIKFIFKLLCGGFLLFYRQSER